MNHLDAFVSRDLFKFTKERRLLRSKDYLFVLRHTARFVTRVGPILLCWVKNLHSSSRLGLIVAKRYIRSSVLRNRLKRVARESFRLSPTLDNERVDIVVRVISPLHDSDWRGLSRIFSKLYESVRG